MKTSYGSIDISRSDIRKMDCWSLDLRDVTGGSEPDETRLCDPGQFLLSVCSLEKDETPIGEIRIMWRGGELSIVGHPTGREGVVEITPEHLAAAMDDSGYRSSLVTWIGEEQSA